MAKFDVALVFILVSIVALTGFFTQQKDEQITGAAVDLAGLFGSETYTITLTRSPPPYTYTFPDLRILNSITGTTCWNHGRTGNYYAYKITGLDGSKKVFEVQYPGGGGFFGGKTKRKTCVGFAVPLVDNKPVTGLVFEVVQLKGSIGPWDVVFAIKTGVKR